MTDHESMFEDDKQAPFFKVADFIRMELTLSTRTEPITVYLTTLCQQFHYTKEQVLAEARAINSAVLAQQPLSLENQMVPVTALSEPDRPFIDIQEDMGALIVDPKYLEDLKALLAGGMIIPGIALKSKT